MHEVTIEGRRVHDIPSLYAEINRVFMADESWELGPSLDALDDLLHGGYGLLARTSPVRVVWTGSEHSRAALGPAATLDWYDAKLAEPGRFGSPGLRARREALLDGTGPTYFEIVEEIFADHPEVELVLR